jgi:beta-galactosidase
VQRRQFLIATSQAALLTRLGSRMRAQAWSDAPVRPPRQRICIDRDWFFYRGDMPGGEAAGLDHSSWRKLDVPHDWSIEGPFAKGNPGEQRVGYLPSGIGWYRKVLDVPPHSRHVAVEFDGVYMNSDVWINGRHLGRRPYGYSSFRYDLTPHLKADGSPNIVAVRADNSKQPNSRYYSGSGIYRHVWLEATNDICVDHWGVAVSTAGVSDGRASIRVETTLRNTAEQRGAVSLRTEIWKNGVQVAEASSEVTLGPATSKVAHDIAVRRPKLWSPDTPEMYLARTTIKKFGKTLDRYDTPFGIRKFHFDANRGLSLNGTQTKLKGVNLHHDLGALGAAFYEPAAERRLLLLKEMGCNAIRMAHNPPAPQLLDLCDRLGFLVIDEAFDEWSAPKEQTPYGYHLYYGEWAERDLRDMVLRDRNHPSIILWSIGNEIPDKGTAEGVQDCKLLSDIVHRTDATRPVTAGVNVIQSANKSGYAQVLDVVGYNGGGNSSAFYDSDHQQYPERKMYGSEVPHTAQSRGIYKSDAHHCSSYFEAFVEMSPEMSWRKTRDREFFAGEFRWIAFDYLGEPTRHIAFHIPAPKQDARWPLRSSEAGICDMAGLPKDAYYFYQSQWTQKPMVHLLPHWTWTEAGQLINVWVFSNCDEVELFVNGRSQRRKAFTHDGPLHLEWSVPFEKGTVLAVGWQNGKEVCRQEIKTAGPAMRVDLHAERPNMHSNGTDVVYLRATVKDAAGVTVPDADERVTFEVNGPAKLIAVDNGDTECHESFQSTSIPAFSGMCIAVVKSTGGVGAITVRAISPGLQEARATIVSR